MRRRAFLGATGTVAAAAAAGCSAIGGPTTLSSPREEVENDGETHLHFADDDRLATLTVDPGTAGSGPLYPVAVHVWHREGTRVTGLTLRFRPTAGSPPNPLGEVYVSIPQWTESPAIELSSTADGEWRVLDVDGMGEYGEGTTSIETRVRPYGDGEPTVTVDATADLREGGVLGSTYRLEGRATVSLASRST